MPNPIINRRVILSSLKVISVAPVASFTTSPNPIPCNIPLTIAFIDTSINNPTSWLWTVTGGTINVDYTYTVGSATSQNPTIRFDTVGNYGITLTATNVIGNNTSGTITVNAGFNPTIVPSIYAFYDAANVTLNSGNVATWVDSINGNDVTQVSAGSQPLWGASDGNINNKPTIIFDGSNDFLTSSSFTISSPFTVYFIVQFNSLAGGYQVIVNDNSVFTTAQIYKNNSTSEIRCYNGLDKPTGFTPIISTYYIYTFVFNGTSSQLYINGVGQGVIDVGSSNMSGLFIAAQIPGLLPFNGKMAALIYSGTANTPTEINNVVTAMNCYWNVF